MDSGGQDQDRQIVVASEHLPLVLRDLDEQVRIVDDGARLGLTPLVELADVRGTANALEDERVTSLKPAALDGVLAVGAVDDEGVPAGFNPRNGEDDAQVAPWIDVFAPGVEVTSTYLGEVGGEDVRISGDDGPPVAWGRSTATRHGRAPRSPPATSPEPSPRGSSRAGHPRRPSRTSVRGISRVRVPEHRPRQPDETPPREG